MVSLNLLQYSQASRLQRISSPALCELASFQIFNSPKSIMCAQEKHETLVIPEEPPCQTLYSRTISSWDLCDMLDRKFPGQFLIVMNDDSYQIWAPYKLRPVRMFTPELL